MTALDADVAAMVDAIRQAVKRHDAGYVRPNPGTNRGDWPYLQVGISLDQVIDDSSWFTSDRLLNWPSQRARRAADTAVARGLLFRYTRPHTTRWKYTYVLPELKAAVDAELALTDGERVERSLEWTRERVERDRQEDEQRRSSDDIPRWMTFRAPYGSDELVAMGAIVEVDTDWERKPLYALAEHAPQYIEARDRAERNSRALDAREAAARAQLVAVARAAGAQGPKPGVLRIVQLTLDEAEAICRVLDQAGVTP